jgi:3-deoxy-D-manno-octulosonate 8-phosphate phosphatase KdsC-like HAD superfamily phosphatase
MKYGAKVCTVTGGDAMTNKLDVDSFVSTPIDWEKTIGIGDDITDLCYLEKCKYILLPNDCHKQLIGWFNPVRNKFAPVSKLKGGQGLLSQLHELIHFHKILK